MNGKLLWLNGEWMPFSDGTISIEDRGFQFGDGIYEVVAAYGGRPFLLAAHMDRMDASAHELRLRSTITREEREEIVCELIRRFAQDRCMVYGQLTRGVSTRGHVFPADAPPTELWYVRSLPTYPDRYWTDGVATITHPDERWARCNIKSTNLLANCIAKQAAAEAGAFEAILLQPGNLVTEASAANVYAMVNGVLRTHPLTNRILPGTKRGLIMGLCEELGIVVEERALKLEELFAAEEVWLSSTTVNLVPVSKIDGKQLSAARWPVLEKLLARINGLIHSQAPVDR